MTSRKTFFIRVTNEDVQTNIVYIPKTLVTSLRNFFYGVLTFIQLEIENVHIC